jgi:hypothetical protein
MAGPKYNALCYDLRDPKEQQLVVTGLTPEENVIEDAILKKKEKNPKAKLTAEEQSVQDRKTKQVGLMGDLMLWSQQNPDQRSASPALQGALQTKIDPCTKEEASSQVGSIDKLKQVGIEYKQPRSFKSPQV